MLLLAQSQQSGTQKWAVSQVKGPLRFLASQPPRFDLADLCRQHTQFGQWQAELSNLFDDLYRLAFFSTESRPQALMPLHNLLHTTLQCSHVQFSTQTHGVRNVERCTARL